MMTKKTFIKTIFLMFLIAIPLGASAEDLKGDVNCDGRIAIDDVTDLINYLLTDDSTGINLENADTYEDGKISIDDVTSLIEILLTMPDEPQTQTESFTVGDVTFKMVTVEGGTFMMGANNDDLDAVNSEKPMHQVTLSSYCIGETEVTQELWLAVMGRNPSWHSPTYYGEECLKHPVERVSWNDCQEFIARLNKVTGKKFRLPTEAEWEFAARGGNKSLGYKYAGSDSIEEVAWFSDREGYVYNTEIVATKKPNELGLYDMTGNVCERCQDWYDRDYYNNSPIVNPAGPFETFINPNNVRPARVKRGGSIGSTPKYCRNTYRYYSMITGKYMNEGLRLALDLDNIQKFRLSETVVIIEKGESTSVDILNGSGNYSVMGGTDYVSASISGNSLTVTGNQAGTTTVFVSDISSGDITFLNVIVNETITDGVSYDRINGIGIKNLWIQDRAHSPELWTNQSYCNTNARTAVMNGIDIYIAHSNAKTVYTIDNVSYTASVIYQVDAGTGSLVKELLLLLDGVVYGGDTLNCNTVGVDDFGHLYMAPMSPVDSTHLPVYLVDTETGSLTLVNEFDKGDVLQRCDYIDVIGDLTREKAECNIMAVGTGSEYAYRWHSDQGGDWEGGFDGDPYLIFYDFYPRSVTQWGSGPVVKMIERSENEEKRYSGETFYIDGSFSAPICYDLTGTLIDSFENVNQSCWPMDVCVNGVVEFTIAGRQFIAYAAAYNTGIDGNTGQNKACQVYICELGENGSMEGMQRYWMIPDELGSANDDGSFIESMNVQYGTDEEGNEEVTLFIFKCNNGMAIYKIGPNVR